MKRIIVIDPGKKKCGLILVDLDKDIVLDGRVVDHLAVIDLIVYWKSKEHIQKIILGNGTTSMYWKMKVKEFFPVELVEERGTTLRARRRYWELWPPSLWLRCLPRGLIVPSVPLDAVAALVLLEDHLHKKLQWPGPTKFRILNER